MRIDMALADSGKLQVLSPKLALKRVSEGITNVCGWASALAGILLVGMVFLIAVTVIGRYVFNQPVTGANEILRLALLGVAFLSLGEVEMRGRHIKVKMLSDKLPADARLILDFSMSILSVGVLVLLTWKSFDLAYDNWLDRTETLVLGLPIYAVMFAMVAGAFLSLLSFTAGSFQKMLDIFRSPVAGSAFHGGKPDDGRYNRPQFHAPFAFLGSSRGHHYANGRICRHLLYLQYQCRTEYTVPG